MTTLALDFGEPGDPRDILAVIRQAHDLRVTATLDLDNRHIAAQVVLAGDLKTAVEDGYVSPVFANRLLSRHRSGIYRMVEDGRIRRVGDGLSVEDVLEESFREHKLIWEGM